MNMYKFKKKVPVLLILLIIGVYVCTRFSIIDELGKKAEFAKIKYGKFDGISNLDTKQINELNNVFENYKHVSQWIYVDLDSDGKKELIWCEKKEEIYSVLGVFTLTQDGCKRILWDISDSDEYYFILGDQIIYYSRYSGIYDRYTFSKVEFDKKFNMEFSECYEILKVTDAKETKDLFENCGEGTHYLKIVYINQKKQYEELAFEEWTEDFENAIGKFDFNKMLQ